ncbi:MAG: hypothetical protein AB7E36_17810 [Salinivirgaceae bacterium]
MVKKLLFFSLFLNTGIIQAQPVYFTGSLLSEKDSLPIEYAHLFLMQDKTGTVSNMEGRYHLKVIAVDDTLRISHLSFNDTLIPLKDFQLTGSIYLTPKSFEMGEVKIIPKDFLERFFKESVAHIPKNYNSRLRYYDAFYREIQYNKTFDKATKVIEACLRMKDRGIRNSPDEIEFELLALRQSDDYALDVSLKYKLLEKAFKLLVGHKNNIYTLVEWDLIRRMIWNNKYGLIRNADSVDYLFEGSYVSASDTIYKIRQIVNHVFYADNLFYINTTDRAMVKLEKTGYLKGYPMNATYVSVEYAKIDGKYMPLMIRKTAPGPVYTDGDTLSEGNYESTLVFTNHQTGRKAENKIVRKNILEKDADLEHIVMPYDSVFWATNNLLIKEPLGLKVINDLGKDLSLDEQFKNNNKP